MGIEELGPHLPDKQDQQEGPDRPDKDRDCRRYLKNDGDQRDTMGPGKAQTLILLYQPFLFEQVEPTMPYQQQEDDDTQTELYPVEGFFIRLRVGVDTAEPAAQPPALPSYQQ